MRRRCAQPPPLAERRLVAARLLQLREPKVVVEDLLLRRRVARVGGRHGVVPADHRQDLLVAVLVALTIEELA